MAPKISAQTYKGLVALVLLIALATAACGTSNASRGNASTPSPATYPPVNLHITTDRYVYTTPQSMCHSVLTSEVVVGSHGQPRWDTQNGQRPPVAYQGFMISTPVFFAYNQPLIDHRTTATTEFVTLGGKVGTDSIYADSYPQVQDGERYIIVFAPASVPADQGLTAGWLIVFDAFPVDGQGMVLLQAAGSPNEPGPGQPQPEIKISLTDLKQQLAACK